MYGDFIIMILLQLCFPVGMVVFVNTVQSYLSFRKTTKDHWEFWHSQLCGGFHKISFSELLTNFHHSCVWEYDGKKFVTYFHHINETGQYYKSKRTDQGNVIGKDYISLQTGGITLGFFSYILFRIWFSLIIKKYEKHIGLQLMEL